MQALVEYEIKNRVGYITLNRPDKRNALSKALVDELKAAFRFAEKDVRCKVIVLAAKGDAFCAGADLAYLQELQQNNFDENLSDSMHLMELFQLMYRLSKVVIARIQGSALAGGCGLATVCDFSFSVPEAKFGYTEVRIGFVPAIVMVFLLRKIGEGRAKELLLSGNSITAEKALSSGLINELIPAEELDEKVQQFAERLCNEASGESLTRTKQMIAAVQDLSLDDALAYAATQNAEARAGEDCRRGIAAFLNKEKITW